MPVDLIWIWSSPIEGSSIVLVSWDVVSFFRICVSGMRDFYTNRTSRGPCRTEALTVAFTGNVG